MARKKLEDFVPNPNSALAKLGRMPKIGSGLSGDINLGFCHQYALKIASEILTDTSKVEADNFVRDIKLILHEWKLSHGQPPQGLSGLLGGNPKPMSESDRKAKLDNLEPWQCHPYSYTPVSLFESLLSDEYKPLEEYLEGRWHKYPYIKAALILASNNPDSEYQSSDCIKAALSLACHRIKMQENFIKIIEPDAKAAFYRRQAKKDKEQAKKQLTREKILERRQECIDGNKVFNNATLAHDCKVSEATVSRHLRDAGIEKYKK